MDEAVAFEEKAYWTNEERQRSLDVQAARCGGDALHLIAGAELRLREAEERVAAMRT